MNFYINILFLYYNRMIYIMVIREHQTKDGKPHYSIESRTPYTCENTVKTLKNHTVRKGRHKTTFLKQPPITIPKHEH